MYRIKEHFNANTENHQNAIFDILSLIPFLLIHFHVQVDKN
jgi:hypothetical protein